MELEKLFAARQSTREYDSRQIDDETLKRICRLATYAPSAVNAQPYKMYAVSGEKAKKFAVNVQPYGRNVWADECAAFIVIQQLAPVEIRRGDNVISNAEFIANGVGILSAYIALAAESEGVQSCIIGLRDEKGIAEFLNLPQGTRFPLIIALGYKADGYPLREKQRRDLNETYTLIK